MADVIVKIEPFDIEQKVYQGEEIYSVNLEKLPDFLVDLDNVDTIHMMGNEKFVNLFVQKIKEKELFKYQDTKLNILINK